MPVALILGHSFVRRLQRDLLNHFDPRADLSFNLEGTAAVNFHGVGGRTVSKIRDLDLPAVERMAPDVVILEIGTNDLTDKGPEVVGSAIDDLVRLLVGSYAIRVVCVCHVIPRGISHAKAEEFAKKVAILAQYLDDVLADIPNAFCWRHRSFTHPQRDFYLDDCVHLNPAV